MTYGKSEDIVDTEPKKFYGHPGFYKLLDQMADLHSKKNHDYSGSDNPLRNFKKCKAMGFSPFAGVIIRMTDKWARLESFMKQGVMAVNSETVEDTLMDNAIYSLLAILLYREEIEKYAKVD
jgi:stalled ribosome alternative rescue factor ArfA